ncbi:MAG: HrcA family transcriptional regulator, partial [Campylobacter sp.]|nr:HrcA family transcriptional regulator [Campylobacter sp.]
IQAYLDNNVPIGSMELGNRMNLQIPASTIRVYFKKLSDEGEITQLHISSGRMPTTHAMKRYWSEKFARKLPVFSINDDRVLKMLCDEFELYCMIFGDLDKNLLEVFSLNNKFLVLDFGDDEIVLRYDSRVEKFLQNLISVGLNKLELICSQVGLNELKNKIKELKRTKIYFQENEILAFKMFEDERFKLILEPSFENYMSERIAFTPLFEDGYMGLKLHTNFKGQSSTMICAGSVYSDYMKFLNEIMEVA